MPLNPVAIKQEGQLLVQCISCFLGEVCKGCRACCSSCAIWACQGVSALPVTLGDIKPSLKTSLCEMANVAVVWRRERLSVLRSRGGEKRWKTTVRGQPRCTLKFRAGKPIWSATYSSMVQEHFLSMNPVFLSKKTHYSFLFENCYTISNPLHF